MHSRPFLRIGLALMLLLGTTARAHASTYTYGTTNTFNGTTYYPAAANIDDSAIIVAYNDNGSGKAVIATVDSTTLTFGGEYQFSASSVSNIGIAMLDSTHALIAYNDNGTGYGVIATIDGSTISYGSPTSFDTSIRDGGQEVLVVTALDSTHAAIAYVTETYDEELDDTTFESNVIVATVSGTSASFGSSYELGDDTGQYVAIAAMDSTHLMMFYNDDDGTPHLLAASVSGTSLTFGSSVAVSQYSSDPTILRLDSTHAAVVYRSGVSDKTYALVATLSGTSVSAGTAQAVTTARAYYPTAAVLSSTRLAMFYIDPDDDYQVYSVDLTVSGGTISGDTADLMLAIWSGQYRNIARLDTTSAVFIVENRAIVGTTDTTAPSTPASFGTTKDGNTIHLNWTNPADDDFLSVTIRRRTGTYPANRTEGTSIASAFTGSTIDDGSLADGTYYYSIFARDLRGNYSSGAQTSEILQTSTSGAAQQASGSKGGSTARQSVAAITTQTTQQAATTGEAPAATPSVPAAFLRAAASGEPAVQLLVNVRMRLTTRIEERITAFPHIKNLLLHVLTRLDQRIEGMIGK